MSSSFNDFKSAVYRLELYTKHLNKVVYLWIEHTYHVGDSCSHVCDIHVSDSHGSDSHGSDSHGSESHVIDSYVSNICVRECLGIVMLVYSC